MMRWRLVPIVAILVACGHPSARPESASFAPVVAQAPQFDSATIERLCVQPDRVRARLAACVLKDQSPPPRFAPAKPPPR